MGGPRRNIPTGCAVHADCLTCPLSRCYLEMPGRMEEARRELADQREQYRAASRHQMFLDRAAVVFDEGLSTAEASQRWGVTTRTVLRYLSLHREHMRSD